MNKVDSTYTQLILSADMHISFKHSEHMFRYEILKKIFF